MCVYNNMWISGTEQTCPGNCTDSSHGKCNSKTGVCKCRKGYYGKKCDSKNIKL